MTSPVSRAAEPRPRPNDARRLVQRKFDNGVRVVVLPTAAAQPETGLEPVAIELWVMAGTSAEADDEHGCAHLLEHMLFKPAPGLPRDLASIIEDLGGDVNAFTSHDETVFHATIPARSVDGALEALGAAVFRPRFEDKVLREEAQVVVEEIRQYRDDPGQRVAQDLFSLLYKRHSYGRAVLATEAEVLSHTAKRLGRFHRRAYAGARVLLVVVGPVSTRRILGRARRLLGALPRARAVARESAPAPLKSPKVVVRRDDVEEAQVILGWQIPAFGSGESCALEVASVILGQGETSRLVREVRRRTQLVSAVHAAAYASRETGTMLVSAHTTPDRIEAATQAIIREVERLSHAPPDDEEFARARALLESDLVYGQETVQGRAHAMGYYASLSGDVQADRRYYALLARQTPALIQAASGRFLQARGLAMSVLVPQRSMTPSALARLRRNLARFVDGSAPKRSKPATRRRQDRHGIQYADLPGGLRIRALHNASVPMAAGWLVWPGGLRLEQERDAGATALIARVLNRGTSDRSGDELARELSGRAASLEGFAGRNSAGLHFECLAADLPLVLRRALECAAAASFPEVEVEEERRVTLQELQAARDDLAQVAIHAMLDGLYGRHPFHRPRAGTLEKVRTIPHARLKRLWTENYPVGRAVLAVAGDFDFDAVVDLVETLVPAGEAPPPMPEWPGRPPRWKKSREHRINRRREQVHIAMGFPGVPMSDSRSETLEVLMAVLGGQSGRLFQALREQEGLVYHVAADSTEGIDAGHVTVYAATSRRKLDRCRAALDREVVRIAEQLTARSELDRAKAWLLGQFEASLQRRSRTAALIGFDEAYALGANRYFRYSREIAAVTAKSVRTLAAELFDARRRMTAIVGPDVE